MNLLKLPDMIKVYIKKIKMSIWFERRLEVLLILSLFLLIISPFVFYSIFRKEPVEIEQAVLSVSPRLEEILGEEITKVFLEEFKKQYPDFQIYIQDYPPADDNNGGLLLPDIIIFEEDDFFSPAAVLHAVPLAVFMDLLFYNIDLLSAAGFDRPPKTREEFLIYARAVSQINDGLPENAAGAAVSLGSRDALALSRDVFSWIYAAGGSVFSGEELSLNTRAVADALSFFGSLYQEELLAPRIFYTTGEQRLEEFAQGRIAMMVASVRAIPYLREKMGDDTFGITAIPDAGLGLRYRTRLSGIYAGINADCRFPDEAMCFLEFLAGQSRLISEIFYAVPGVIDDFMPGSFVRGDPFYSKAWDFYSASEIAEDFRIKRELEAVFIDELRSFFEGGKPAQETVAAIQRYLDQQD